MSDDERRGRFVVAETLPRLEKNSPTVLFNCLQLPTRLSEHNRESASKEVDFRDLRVFIGEDEAKRYDGQPLNTVASFSDWGDITKIEWSVDLYQTDLLVGEQWTPFGRLAISVKDKRLLSKGSIRIDLRRFGDHFVLDLDVFGRMGYQFHLDNQEGSMSQTTSIPLDDRKFGILNELEKYLGNDPANVHLVQGLKNLLLAMTDKAQVAPRA